MEIEITHDVDRVGWAGKTVRVVFDNVGSLKDALDGAGFDIELVIAEAILSAYLQLSECVVLRPLPGASSGLPLIR